MPTQVTDLTHQYQTALVAIGAIVVALESLARSLQVLVGVLRWCAGLTASKVDDAEVGKLSAALDWVADKLHAAQTVLPRAAVPAVTTKLQQAAVARASTPPAPPPAPKLVG